MNCGPRGRGVAQVLFTGGPNGQGDDRMKVRGVIGQADAKSKTTGAGGCYLPASEKSKGKETENWKSGESRVRPMVRSTSMA